MNRIFFSKLPLINIVIFSATQSKHNHNPVDYLLVLTPGMVESSRYANTDLLTKFQKACAVSKGKLITKMTYYVDMFSMDSSVLTVTILVTDCPLQGGRGSGDP